MEWGPITILQNENGILKNITSKLNLDKLNGWWNGIATGDFNEDGLMDIVATNWGLNTKYHFTPSHPRKVFFNDFDNNNVLDIVEAHYDGDFNDLVPERGFSCISNAMPFVREEKQTFLNYAQSTLNDIFGNTLETSPYLEANTLESVVLINNGGSFTSYPLPFEAQISTAMHAGVADINGDGHEDIFLSQNFFAVQIETDRNDSGRGLIMLGDGNGNFETIYGHNSGILVYGDQRGAAFSDYNNDGRVDLLVSQNGAETKLFQNIKSKSGVRVILRGSKLNPWGFGSKIQIKYKDGSSGPVREIQSGSGYWSQNSPVQIMGYNKPVSSIKIQWPDGSNSSESFNEEKVIIKYTGD